MKITGFTIAKNATKLYYPVKAAIASILPIVDEFVVGLGDSDADDQTEEEILSIGSDKIKIIRTVWDTVKFPNGMEYARQTDLVKDVCTGDWLFYIQSDEVVHEKYLPLIKVNCEKYLHEVAVEGFLFNYKHFRGDYDHYVISHAWYPREIRIVRNDPQIHSWRDAQSFRKIPHFDRLNYYQKKGTAKLKVVPIDAEIYHYGFVRPPSLMQDKTINHYSNYLGEAEAEELFKNQESLYDYGDLSKLTVFTDSHPKVMEPFIAQFNWRNQLRYTSRKGAKTQKHEKLKYRILTFIEQNFLGGRLLFGFKNYQIIKGS